MGRDCASERVPIGLAEADQRPPGPLRGGRWGMSQEHAPHVRERRGFPCGMRCRGRNDEWRVFAGF